MVEAPFAFVVGALHALPEGTSSKLCSGYIVSSRSGLIDAVDNFGTN